MLESCWRYLDFHRVDWIGVLGFQLTEALIVDLCDDFLDKYCNHV